MTKGQMIETIIRNCKANNVYTSGDMFLQLAFMSEESLHKLCAELHITKSY